MSLRPMPAFMDDDNAHKSMTVSVHLNPPTAPITVIMSISTTGQDIAANRMYSKFDGTMFYVAPDMEPPGQHREGTTVRLDRHEVLCIHAKGFQPAFVIFNEGGTASVQLEENGMFS